MIAQFTDERCYARFLEACEGKPYFGCVLPLHALLFGQSQLGRFFAGPGMALELRGRTAEMTGACDAEELASFLRLCGVESLLTDGTVPAGWRLQRVHHRFVLEAGSALPLPPADEALWGSLTLDRAPKAGRIAAWLFPDRPQRRDDFYSELCTKRNHGAAQVWALEQSGRIVCTVGAYALYHGEAYMACGQTEPELRGRGVGGRLIVQLANELAAQGWRVSFLCADERVPFYTRLGFAPRETLPRYAAPEETE